MLLCSMSGPNEPNPLTAPNDTNMELGDAPQPTMSGQEPPPLPARPNSPAPTQASSSQQDDLVSTVLKFLSTATTGSLGAVAVGLAAVTYFLLGQLGLLLIGAFAGIVWFISWESHQEEVSRAVHGEKGHDLLARLLEGRDKSRLSGPQIDLDPQAEGQMLAHSFDDFQPETREALNSLLDAVVHNYIDWWYGSIVPSDRAFPLSCRKILTNFILTVSNKLSRERPADAFIDFLTNSCSIIIVFFSEMMAAYSTMPSDTSAADAIYTYLATQADCPLANLLNTRQQSAKFRIVAEDLLSSLDRSAYDCDPARIFLREVIATVILEGTLQTCSKPEWINSWIVYLLEAGETDLSQAIDVAIQDQKAFSDVDGNFGSISLAKGNRNNYEADKARKTELAHKKSTSKADDEMERAMEEMKRLNEMIATADKSREGSTTKELLTKAVTANAKVLEMKMDSISNGSRIPNALASSALGPSATELAMKSSPSTKRHSVQDEPLNSPITPRSVPDLPSQKPSPQGTRDMTPFTSVDRLGTAGRGDPEDDVSSPPPLSLHNAIITVHDDPGNDKARLRSKPTWEYLVQIEPAASQHPGWMVMRTIAQLEALHESLRRIANVSGATAFLEAHSAFPSWKLHTRLSLRGEIERYLRAACIEKPLAESEAMKKFFERGRETRAASNKGFSFESMGKGMLGAISNAPKGALDGGKVVVGGVTNVLGNIGLGQRKSINVSSTTKENQVTKSIGTPTRHQSMSALHRTETGSSLNGSMVSRDSMDSQRSSVTSTRPPKTPGMEARPSHTIDVESEGLRASQPERKSNSTDSSRAPSRGESCAEAGSPLCSPSESSLRQMNLPPPPTEIPDDYGSPTALRRSVDILQKANSDSLSPQMAYSSTFPASTRPRWRNQQPERRSQGNGTAPKKRKQYPPLSEPETRVAVELLFAVVNELYTLSSAWNFRRTLLAAAKSFLLRPGNPSLASIRKLIQETVLEANTSDAGIAAHVRKVRENSLPTEEERKAWPAEATEEDKEELKLKARRLFLQSGVPAALMGIMGQSATSEALGRVFDCLQIEEVARGLFFGVLLQLVRVITH